MKKTLITRVFIFLFSITAFAQADEKYTEMLDMILDSEDQENFEKQFEETLTMFKESSFYTKVPSDFWEAVEKDFDETSTKQLAQLMTPVFNEYFTLEDFQQGFEIYDDPVLIKYMQNIPTIMMQQMEPLIKSFIEQVEEDVAKRIQEQGAK